MLKVGLTGGLGSGKSTVAELLRELGAYVLSADEMGRKLMEPGRPVFAAIAERFGPEVVLADGTLNRAALARIAFAEGKVEELNAIVHPATIELQGQIVAEIFRRDLSTVMVVESALIFETKYGDGWRGRFDKIVLVTAPEEMKIARFVARSGGQDRTALEAEARRRLSRMIPDEQKAGQCDFVIRNDRTLYELKAEVSQLWQQLQA